MNSLELSIIEAHGEKAILTSMGIEANITTFTWDTYWGKLLDVAFHRDGPDVSEVGAPSTGGVISMNVLRPFTRQEIKTMGGEEVFVPQCWRTTTARDDQNTWAIPFYADVRIFFYWRDLMEKAKADPETAFQTPEAFENSLNRLQVSGIKTPWAFYAGFAYSTLHVASMWVWAGGGEILEGSHFALADPTPMKSLQTFFRLRKYMPRESYKPNNSLNLVDAFVNREIAVICAGTNMLGTLRKRLENQPAMLQNLSISSPPGPAYIGGTNMVIWAHSREERKALALVQQLTSKDFQLAFCQKTGFLPVRLDTLAEPPYSTDPLYQKMVQALKKGHSYPLSPRWGLVEDRLSTTFLSIWQHLYDNPEADSDAVLERILQPMANRLNLTLSEYG